MCKKISLLLPTRNRKFLVKRLFHSILRHTKDLNNLEIVLCIDDDDENSQSIREGKLQIIKNIGPSASMGTLNTRALESSSGDIIMLMNDDLVICTPEWDQKIREIVSKIPDDVYIAYPDDMERANLSTFPIISRNTCEILVNPYPEEYDALFIDNHIFDIFIRLKHIGENRIYYLNNIQFDHRHFINGKIRPDAEYIHKNRYKDYLTFIALRETRQITANRLCATINKKPLPEFPAIKSKTLDPPENIINAIFHYSWLFLKDKGLPMNQRILWSIRFTKYYAAMKGGFKFLKTKSYDLYGS